LAFVDKATHGDHALAIAEDDVKEGFELDCVGFDAEGVLRDDGIIEIAPGIEVADFIVRHDRFFPLMGV
jgi:hypothetical protein